MLSHRLRRHVGVIAIAVALPAAFATAEAAASTTRAETGTEAARAEASVPQCGAVTQDVGTGDTCMIRADEVPSGQRDEGDDPRDVEGGQERIIVVLYNCRRGAIDPRYVYCDYVVIEVPDVLRQAATDGEGPKAAVRYEMADSR